MASDAAAGTPLRIAMVSMHTSPVDRPGTGDAGGLNVVVLEAARALAARGHLVDLFTRAPGAARTSSIAPGITLCALDTGGGIVRKHDLPLLADAFGTELERVATHAAHAYDVLHAHYWLSGLAALPVSLSLGIPIVQTFHTLAVEKNRRLLPGDRPEPERRVRTERYLASEVDAVVAVSGAEVEVLLDDLDAPAERVWRIAPGIDAEVFRPAPLSSRGRVRARLSVRMEDALLACVGRVQPLKGQELAIRMLQHLPGAQLVIAGDATPGAEDYLERLRALEQELGVAERVRHIGSLDRQALAALYDAADVVVVPSVTESFGLVALEAAATGTPVVAARAGGLVEAVQDGVTGVLVDGRAPLDWAEAVAGVLDDEDRALALGLAGRRLAAQRGWQQVATDLEAVYRAVSRP